MTDFDTLLPEIDSFRFRMTVLTSKLTYFHIVLSALCDFGLLHISNFSSGHVWIFDSFGFEM